MWVVSLSVFMSISVSGLLAAWPKAMSACDEQTNTHTQFSYANANASNRPWFACSRKRARVLISKTRLILFIMLSHVCLCIRLWKCVCIFMLWSRKIAFPAQWFRLFSPFSYFLIGLSCIGSAHTKVRLAFACENKVNKWALHLANANPYPWKPMTICNALQWHFHEELPIGGKRKHFSSCPKMVGLRALITLQQVALGRLFKQATYKDTHTPNNHRRQIHEW